MIGSRALATFGVAAVLSVVSVSADAALVIDDFESYDDGAIVADTASSQPWLRNGNAVADDLIATENVARVINGQVSAQIPLNWNNGTSAQIRRNFGTLAPVDLSGYDEAVIKVRSTNASSTADIKLVISDGSTIYQSVTGYTVTGSVQTLTFDINTSALTLASGSGSLASVMDSVVAIGFRFGNTLNAAGDTMIVDDFVLNPIPEPATLGLLATGGLLLGRRRRDA